MDTKSVLSFSSVLLVIAGYIPYIYAIVRGRDLPRGTPGKVEPSKASWLIWATLDVVIIWGMALEGTVNSQIVAVVIGVWVTVFFVLRYGVPGWTNLDWFCLAGAVVGIVLIIFSSPVLGIITSLAVVCIGSIPTFVSAWQDPGRENKLAWNLFTASSICTTIGIPIWTWADAAQPIAFLSVQGIMMYILYIKPMMRADAKKQVG